MISSNQRPNVPLTHVFLPRLRMLESENNTCIKSPMHEVIDEQNYIPRRLKRKSIVRVSRIKPARETKLYGQTTSEKIRTGRVNDFVHSSSNR